MIETRIGASQRRMLEVLKRRGSGTVPELGAALQLGVETIRTHMKVLRREGLVERRGSRRSGPGRPEIVYALTDSADAIFPNQEGQLLRDLASFLEREGRADLVRAFFDAQVERRRAVVGARLDGLEGGARIDEVARVLTDEGFMAEVETDVEGRRILRLCHCPMRNLVEVTRAPCRSEVRFVRELLGERPVRVSYIPSGDAACCYTLNEDA